MRVFLLLIMIFFGSLTSFSQVENPNPISISADYFYGTILEHNPEIQHLITGHPNGFLLSYNHKTFGQNEWEHRYNFPDWGFSTLYHHSQNEHLGNVLGLYGHINWYFLNRYLMVGVGQGIGYATNPYDTNSNFYNNAYGSRFMSTTYFRGTFNAENIWNGFGFQAGISVVHYSNGNLKAPNNSTNSLVFTIGANYILDAENFPEYVEKELLPSKTYAEPITFNFEFRGGFNENDVIGSGRKPFFVFSTYADKRLNYKSSFQAGVDVFFSTFIKEYIHYRSIAYPEDGLTGEEDYKRIGIFIGHEWRFNRVAMIAQLGYYAYWPNEFENRIYNRLGLKRYILKNNVFASVSVKAHWAKAEAIEFGIGYRL